MDGSNLGAELVINFVMPSSKMVEVEGKAQR